MEFRRVLFRSVDLLGVGFEFIEHCFLRNFKEVLYRRFIARYAHQREYVDNQRYAAVTQDGGSGYTRYFSIIGFQILDHDLVLPDKVIDQQGKADVLGL